MSKHFVAGGMALAIAALSGVAQAQPPISGRAFAERELATPPQPGAIPLRPGAKDVEQWEDGPAGRNVRNVTAPTLTPFLPDPAKATGAAVIVAPGGAFMFLMMDNEGYDVARWLADHGVAAFVLKYRTEPTPRATGGFIAAVEQRLGSVTAHAGDAAAALRTPEPTLEDAEAAVRLVRSHAAQWKVDPTRVGFIGFSAGAITSLSVALTNDAASRPDFVGLIYGPMTAREVPLDAPPLFAAIAMDDPFFAKGRTLGLIDSWSAAGRPVEAHLYDHGGHGFAAGATNATRLWKDELLAWMQDRRLLEPVR
jgi:acetyl esterase/lipase